MLLTRLDNIRRSSSLCMSMHQAYLQEEITHEDRATCKALRNNAHNTLRAADCSPSEIHIGGGDIEDRSTVELKANGRYGSAGSSPVAIAPVSGTCYT